MNALRLDPSTRTFAQFYEDRSGPRFSRKTLFAVGITALCYGGLGLYFMSQKVELAPAEQRAEDTAISVQQWFRPPQPKPITNEREVTARRVDNVVKSTVDPLPFTPTNTASDDDVMPTTATDSDQTSVAPPADPGPPIAVSGVLRNPVWITRPTADQMADRYPVRAADRGMTGEAALLCGVRANGTMTDCVVANETPAGWRFGDAALSLARYFKISPKTVDGQLVEGSKVRIAIVFKLPD